MDAKRRQSVSCYLNGKASLFIPLLKFQILKVKDENEKVQEEKDGVNRRVSFANTKLIKQVF